MTADPRAIAYRTVGEWSLRSERPYRNPYADVAVEGAFTAPSGETLSIPGFYDGEQTWRVRFNPAEAGRWRYHILARPADPALTASGEFDVAPRQGHEQLGGQTDGQEQGQADGQGFLRATPGQAWGFQHESGQPVFILGDTVYNLFGMAHCGADVEPLLRRRATQGFNLIRARVPVSPINVPPDGLSTWQTCSTWPWGGVPQLPLFDRFNLAYFRTVDRVVQLCERIGIGLELIMEGWPYEFPFNRRDLFLPQWEELWLRYLIARYDAFNCVHIWTIQNEYEFYPDNDRARAKTVADRWALRVARLVKGVACHGHVVAVHNTRQDPPFAERFAADPGAIDAVMYQEDWGGARRGGQQAVPGDRGRHRAQPDGLDRLGRLRRVRLRAQPRPAAAGPGAPLLRPRPHAARRQARRLPRPGGSSTGSTTPGACFRSSTETSLACSNCCTCGAS